MKAHILQHVPFEDIGSIRPWLENQQADITYTRFFDNERLPELKELDLLIVLGGPMSVNDEDIYPWLRPEKKLIFHTIQAGVPVIGICLGAQLIAGSLGASVYRNAHKEIGWFPIISTISHEDVFRFPSQCQAFHWHGETFDLPSGAIRLASSEACRNQAFQIGRHVFGLQFHLETTPESVRALIDHCRNELISGPYIQTEEQLQQIAASEYSGINATMNELLAYATSISSGIHSSRRKKKDLAS
jgi:GMP synthase-like glutamine amidotransferase